MGKYYTADDYRSWGFKAYEDCDFRTLKEGTFAFLEDRCIALCLEEGNARNKCLTPNGALNIASELKNFYSQTYREEFPVPTKGLAFEFMYHAYPDLVIDALKASSSPSLRDDILEALLEHFNVDSHFYWADSYTTDKLRILDDIVTDCWDTIEEIFEDLFPSAKNLDVDNASRAGGISEEGEEDYYKFTVTKKDDYVIETTGDTDVCGILYNKYGVMIDEDDDSGDGRNFKIEKYLRPGTYYVKVYGYKHKKIGRYLIKVYSD